MLPGREADPEQAAHIVIDNERPGSPVIEGWAAIPGGGGDRYGTAGG
jgi:hypothetical protein